MNESQKQKSGQSFGEKFKKDWEKHWGHQNAACQVAGNRGNGHVGMTGIQTNQTQAYNQWSHPAQQHQQQHIPVHSFNTVTTGQPLYPNIGVL